MYSDEKIHKLLLMITYIPQVYSTVEEKPISRILEIPDKNTLNRVFSVEKQMLPKTGKLHVCVTQRFFPSQEESSRDHLNNGYKLYKFFWNAHYK